MGIHLNFNYDTNLWEIRNSDETVMYSGNFEDCESEVEKSVGRL